MAKSPSLLAALVGAGIFSAGSSVSPLGPTTASFAAGASAGTPIAAVTGLSPGETVTGVTPNDGRLAIASGSQLVAGLSSSSAGSINATLTTSLGRSLGIAITVTSASSLPMPNSIASAVFFGDSISNNVGASDTAHSWTSLVAAALGATLLNKAISGTVLQNSDGGSGPLASNGRDRYLPSLTSGNRREMAFVAYGFNDARYVAAPSTFNVTEYQNDLGEVVAGLLMTGYTADKIVLVSPYWISDTGLNTGSTGFSGQTRAGFEAFVAACAAVAATYGVYYVDAYAGMRDGGGASLIGPDNIHPNDTGHAKIKDLVLAARRTPVAAAVTPFLIDTFTDADGTAITSHTSDSGHTWSLQSGYSAASPNLINNGKMYSQTAQGVYKASATPPSADYAVGALLDPLSVIASDNVGVFGRASVAANTLYWGRYNRSVNAWQLFKNVGGTATQLGANVSDTFADTSGARYIELRMKGSTISLAVMGVEIISVTDTSITQAGSAGVRMGLAQGATTGIQIDSLRAFSI